MNLTNYKKAKIFISIIKILLLSNVILYLVIILSNYLDYQFIKTLEIINQSITSLLGTKITTELKIHLTSEVLKVTTLVACGEMLLAFATIKNIYILIIKLKKLKNPEKLVEINMTYLFKRLQISLPYLELTSKLFYINVYLRAYTFITFMKPNIVLLILLSLLILAVVLKIYTILKEDINKLDNETKTK